MNEDIFTNEALADEAFTEEVMPGETLGLPLEEIAAAEADYPTEKFSVTAPEATLLEMFGSVQPAEPTVAMPTVDVPHFEPIHLTEQIPLEYAAAQADAPVPISANGRGEFDWTMLPQRPISRTPRPLTIVWGFILLATGLGLIASEAGHPVDFGLGMIWLFAAAGVTLVAAAVVSGLRKKTA